MKFDRRIFSNIVLFVVLIAVTVIMTMCQATSAIKIAFGDEIIGISSKDYAMNIAYGEVSTIELVDDPDLGSVSDGKNRPELYSGIWENQSWGEYRLCFNPNATNCIVVHLKDGQTYVFNYNTTEKTAETYQEFLTHIS